MGIRKAQTRHISARPSTAQIPYGEVYANTYTPTGICYAHHFSFEVLVRQRI